MRIDTAAVLRAAPTFPAAGERVRRALDDARSAIEALGEFWGADEQGARFAADYSPMAEQTLQAVRNIADGLMSIGPGLEAMASNHRDVDEHYAAVLSPGNADHPATR